MPAEWSESIAAKLEDSLGTTEQKREVYRVTLELDRLLDTWIGRNGLALAKIIRRAYEGWVHHMRYLIPAEDIDHKLPESVLLSNAEIGGQYQLRTQKGIIDKQVELEAWANIRIARCADHLAAGRLPEDCIGFVRSREEWRRAKERAR